MLAGFESPVLCCGGHVGLSPSHNHQYHHLGLTGMSRLVSHSGECSVLIQVPLHRMCVAGLNSKNIDYVANAIAAVLQ